MSAVIRKLLLDTATAPYRSADFFAWRFARGKLRGDPVFFALLERGLIPDGKRLIDLGCGQGLLASWLLSARLLYESGAWPASWAAAPKVEVIWGLELMPKDIARARAALGERAQFSVGDICSTDFGKADIAVILDVLHYMDYAAQESVIRQVREALTPSGVFITRIGNAAGGWPFRISNWVDHTAAFLRGHRLPKLYCRSIDEWKGVLKKFGFSVEATPMSKGTPFDNVLLIAKPILNF